MQRISIHVEELTITEAFEAFTVEFECEDGRTRDLWEVRKRSQQRGSVVMDYEADECPAFTPNVGSVVDSSKLHASTRAARLLELQNYYQNSQNEGLSIFPEPEDVA